jgi:hypothetical protein
MVLEVTILIYFLVFKLYLFSFFVISHQGTRGEHLTSQKERIKLHRHFTEMKLCSLSELYGTHQNMQTACRILNGAHYKYNGSKTVRHCEHLTTCILQFLLHPGLQLHLYCRKIRGVVSFAAYDV